jgi:hypothetical protein
MIPQIPAQGVLQVKDYGPCKIYKVICDCGDDDCSHTIDVEADDCTVTVTIYTQQKTNFWSKTRWQHIWQLLTTGQARFETAIVLSKQVAFNYSNVLKLAAKDVENYQNLTRTKNL